MKLYFSGVASPAERDMLLAAGVRDYLSDLTDYQFLPSDCAFALDSGAYRAWKAGKELSVQDWLAWIDEWAMTHPDRRPDFIIMPDILGELQATLDRWLEVQECLNDQISAFDLGDTTWHSKVVPVWQWGASRDQLDALCAEGEIVCLGGLVPAMREKNEQVLTEVEALCRDYGNHLHFLGLNWLRAMYRLMPLLKSADTSKWLDGARYGHAFILGPDGCLEQTHRNYSGKSFLDREELCADCALTLRQWVDGELKVPATPIRPVRIYQMGAFRTYDATPSQKAGNLWTQHVASIEAEKRHELAKARRG